PVADAGGHGKPTPAGTSKTGATSRGLERSSADARFAAFASRTASGVSPKRLSINRRIDVWSKSVCDTAPRGANGEIRIVGTRKPRRWNAGWTSGARPGRTWSKKPPHSSKVITSSVDGQAGLVVTAR